MVRCTRPNLTKPIFFQRRSGSLSLSIFFSLYFVIQYSVRISNVVLPNSTTEAMITIMCKEHSSILMIDIELIDFDQFRTAEFIAISPIQHA